MLVQQIILEDRRDDPRFLLPALDRKANLSSASRAKRGSSWCAVYDDTSRPLISHAHDHMTNHAWLAPAGTMMTCDGSVASQVVATTATP